MAAATPATPAQPAKSQPSAKVDVTAAINDWISESIACAPPAEKVHISTHLRACVPALVEKLK